MECNSPRAEGANGLASGQRGSVGRALARRLEAARTERAASSQYSRGHHLVCRVVSSGSCVVEIGRASKERKKEKRETRKGGWVCTRPLYEIVRTKGFSVLPKRTICGMAGVREVELLPFALAGIRRSAFPASYWSGTPRADLMPLEISATVTPPPFFFSLTRPRQRQTCLRILPNFGLHMLFFFPRVVSIW